MTELQDLPLRKIALGIEYDGSKYYGWQRQNEVRSVQEKLEKALSKVANAPVNVFCAGRTDAGVHATGQVVHFETQAVRKDAAWTLRDLAQRLAVTAMSSTIIVCVLRFYSRALRTITSRLMLTVCIARPSA